MKTSIYVDRDAATEAAEVLGTTTLRDTIDAALREVVQTELRRQLAEEILAGMLAVPTPGEAEQAKLPKVASDAPLEHDVRD